MVKRLDWLPNTFYVSIIVMGVVFSLIAGVITDWDCLIGNSLNYHLNWEYKIIKGNGETAYKIKHLIEYVSGDLFIVPFVIAAKKWLNKNKIGYFICCFVMECLTIDIIFLFTTNPHEYSVSKWQTYGISIIIVAIKYLIDGRHNNNSLLRKLNITK